MNQKHKNNKFKFKRFSISHGFNSFKIGTDAVILGAWAGHQLIPNNVLDIGTGSGVVALMIAQRHELANIIGIEINPSAANQAQLNFKESPFLKRLKSINIDIKEYIPDIKFELIISNPPFFNNGILPKNKTNARSKHNISLVPEDIFHFASKHLNSGGLLSLIYPASQGDRLIELAKKYGLYPKSILKISSRINMPAHRFVLEFSKNDEENVVETFLYIENEKRHDFHSTYKNLCKDFYLKF